MRIKKEIYANIRGYNRHLTVEHLDTLDWEALLCNVHPMDRDYFRRKLQNEGLIK
jgi:hypothetical protein